MKILLISMTNNIQSGGGNLTHELCMYLKSQSIDFTLLLPLDEKHYDYVSYSVEYILPSYIFTSRTPKILKYIFFKYKTDADLVHSVFEFPYAIVAERIARVNKIPLLIGLAGTYAVKPLFYFPDNFLLKRAYNNASYLTSISQFTADNVKKYSGTKTEMNIIHCAANFERFSQILNIDDLKKKYEGKKVLLTVGALKPRKGHDIVLKSLSILKKERDDFHYIIIGNNEERSVYMNTLNDLIKIGGLENNVSFAGSVSNESLPKYFQLCDVYIHTPVTTHWNFEGFGIVYLEAGAARKPVIASQSGGVLDAVVPNKTGLVVSEGDVNETYEAIKKILNDEILAKRLGDGGYEYAREHTWDKIGNKFIQLYNYILSSK